MNFTKNIIYESYFFVSEKVYSGFINLFQDRNPMHTDEQYARARGFQDKLMHGNILNGFLSFFIGECLPVKNLIIHQQVINYRNPVYLNDTLKLVVEVINIFESVNAVECRFRFYNTQNMVVANGEFQIGILA